MKAEQEAAKLEVKEEACLQAAKMKAEEEQDRSSPEPKLKAEKEATNNERDDSLGDIMKHEVKVDAWCLLIKIWRKRSSNFYLRTFRSWKGKKYHSRQLNVTPTTLISYPEPNQGTRVESREQINKENKAMDKEIDKETAPWGIVSIKASHRLCRLRFLRCHRR